MDNATAGAVSVIIPAYNAAAYVKRAIDSVLRQTYPPLEILVVDDGSRDTTAEIVAKLAPPVRLIRKDNGGPASARNLGAREAKGKWLALLDADDWWFPDKLRTQMACSDDEQVGIIHCLADHGGTDIPDQLNFPSMWERNWIINSSVLIRRTAFEELGGFNEAKGLISVEDYNLWLRFAASRWSIRTCHHVLVHYTRGIGISSNSDRFMAASLCNIEELGKRLKLDPAIVRRKQNEIVFDFARRALFERELDTARRLFWKAFCHTPSLRYGMQLAIATIPRPVLDMKRGGARLVRSLQKKVAPVEGIDEDTGFENDTLLLQLGEGTQASILDNRDHTRAQEDRLSQPVLIITVDAEEDFDWTRPFSPIARDVTSMRSQHLAHRIFERYDAAPTYMVDHPVASQDEGRAPLKELLQAGLCDIGAQLHPWVTPPFVERMSDRNSYAGNLPAALEFAKIQTLTGELEAAFGITPRIFRAGRYGVGPNTARVLRHFDYQADSSVVPCWTFSKQGGPDFRRMTASPFWIDRSRSLLELPVSAALVGRAAGMRASLTNKVFSPSVERTGLPSVLAHLGLIERIKLTPEGIAIEEAKRLVRFMLSHGHRVFVMTYHSPSLEPGNTPYVRSQGDLQRFLAWIDEFLAFFTTEVGGRCASWREVRSTLAGGN